MNTSRLVVIALTLVLVSGDRVRGQTPAKETLADAWARALAVDRQLQASHASAAGAEHAVDAAVAARRPTVSVEGGYSALDHAPSTTVDIPPILLPGATTPFELPFDRLTVGQISAWTYRASASLPLFTSGRIAESITASRARLDAARADTARAQLDLKLYVSEAFVAVLRAGRLLEVAESEIASLQAHAADADHAFALGLTAKNDVLAAQVSLADARQRRIQIANALDIAQATYNRLLDWPLDRVVSLDEPALPAIDGDLDTLTARALAQRPEIAALARRGEALTHEATSLRAVNGPQAAVTGGYAYQQNRYQLYPGLWSVGFNLRWNLFDGGVKRSEAAAVRSQAAALDAQRHDALTRIALEVRQAWRDLEEARQRIQVAREAMTQADENLRVTRDRYSEGVGTATEVLDADALRTRAQTNVANAWYDMNLAALRLRRATGEL